MFAFTIEYHNGFFVFEQIRGGYLWAPDTLEQRIQTTASVTKKGQFFTTYIEIGGDLADKGFFGAMLSNDEVRTVKVKVVAVDSENESL